MIKCENCKREFENKDIIITVKNGCDLFFYCRECNSQLGHCPACLRRHECGFFNDPDPLPKFIVIQKKQQHANGYTIIQQQVPNTERLRKFCLDGKCKCCNEIDPKDPFCCRFTVDKTCGNYLEKGDLDI